MGRRMVTWLASAVLLAACGGGAASQTAEPVATAPTGAAPVAPVAEESGGLARQGDRCDYGGAERMTCTGGLECCYGEHQTPDGYGTCQAECNWD